MIKIIGIISVILFYIFLVLFLGKICGLWSKKEDSIKYNKKP